jgi:hypothetical protein
MIDLTAPEEPQCQEHNQKPAQAKKQHKSRKPGRHYTSLYIYYSVLYRYLFSPGISYIDRLNKYRDMTRCHKEKTSKKKENAKKGIKNDVLREKIS